MATNTYEQKKKELDEKRKELEKLKIHSEAIAKLYKPKNQINNSRNTKR
jgi:hypothetical protein